MHRLMQKKKQKLNREHYSSLTGIPPEYKGSVFKP